MPRGSVSLKNMGGRMVSGRSKTGDPECSRAMSVFSKARHSGAAIPAIIFKILGLCRAKARMLGAAGRHEAAGNALKAQALRARAAAGMTQGDRNAKAIQLRAARAARMAAAGSGQLAAPTNGPTGRSLMRARSAHARTVERAGIIPGYRASSDRAGRAPVNSLRSALGRARPIAPPTAARVGAPAPPSAPPAPFRLKQESAKKSVPFKNAGPGKTRFLFDMREGDLPGQMSIMDKARIIDMKHKLAKAPGRGTPERLARAKYLREDRAASAAAKAATARATASTGERTWNPHTGIDIEGTPGSAPHARISQARWTAARMAQAKALRSQRATRLPARTADTMSDAIAMSSPSGRMSARAKQAASKRLGEKLFGPGGLPHPTATQPAPAEAKRAQAKQLRDLAARGMATGKYNRHAQRLEDEADALEGKSPRPAQANEVHRMSDMIGEKRSPATPGEPRKRLSRRSQSLRHAPGQAPAEQLRPGFGRIGPKEAAPLGRGKVKFGAAVPGGAGMHRFQPGDARARYFAAEERRRAGQRAGNPEEVQRAGREITGYAKAVQREKQAPRQFALTHNGAGPAGPAAQIAAADTRQLKGFGASLWSNRRLSKPAPPAAPAPKPAPGSAGPKQFQHSLAAQNRPVTPAPAHMTEAAKIHGWKTEAGKAAREAKLNALIESKRKAPAPAPAPPAPPTPPATSAAAKGRNLLAAREATAAKLKAARAAMAEHSAPEAHGKPGSVYEIATKHVKFDPKRFQYKLDTTGAHGTGEALKDVKKWDPELAGVVSVWKDPANGHTYVVNGHHRMHLANQLGVDKVHVKYLHAKNAEEARAKGAMVNIAEGRGTAIDAAKFFRDSGITHEHAKAAGLSLREHTAKQGLAMSHLEPRVFDRVVNGEISPARAAIIGGGGLSHAQQAQLVKVLDQPKNRKLTDGTVKAMVDSAKEAGSRTKTVRDLFGSSEQEEARFIHRAQVEDGLKRTLSADKRLFGLVSRSKAAEALAERGGTQVDREATGHVGKEAATVLGIFDQLKNKKGPVSSALNEAADEIAAGGNRKKAEAKARAAITAHIKGVLDGSIPTFGAHAGAA